MFRKELKYSLAAVSGVFDVGIMGCVLNNDDLIVRYVLMYKKNNISKENEFVSLEAKYPTVKLVYANKNGLIFS